MTEATGVCVLSWKTKDVCEWSHHEQLSQNVIQCIQEQTIDGKCLLALTESDIRSFRDVYYADLTLGDIKRFWIAVRTLQRDNHASVVYLGLAEPLIPPIASFTAHSEQYAHTEYDRVSPPLSIDGQATSLQPEFFKTTISLGYAFLVTWITAFVMVVVHERVPDMKRYPPLPDIFLDNVPHIPWAFNMCEITGTLLFTIWLCVLVVHRHRMVLLRRFFALSGTVFLLRCVTMLITSLSVPGTHLQCTPRDHHYDDDDLHIMEGMYLRVSRAYTIWSGLGMSIQGVRTCGDYMFSGHTVALTILNFFITEYTPRRFYFLHTLTWLLNMFGIFFILAAHEHYSIDVFVAFYITSRLFLYYHTLANNQALMSHDSNRTRIWFPLFSYFESSVDGIIPNEYDTITDVIVNIFGCVTYIKDICMLTARRFWVTHNQMPPGSVKSFRRSPTSNPASPLTCHKTLNNAVVDATAGKQIKANTNGNLLQTNDDLRHTKATKDTIQNVDSFELSAPPLRVKKAI